MQIRPRAFTLIELLIVVGIIAILAAIAVPNFLEAQVRAKVSRVHADERTIATAIEAYSVDWNEPPFTFSLSGGGSFQIGTGGFSIRPIEEGLIPLSTPVAYMSASNIEEPFNAKRGWLLYEGWDILDQGTGPADAGLRKALYLYVALPPDGVMNNPIVVQFLALFLSVSGQAVTIEDVRLMARKRWFVVSPGPDTFFSFDRCMLDTDWNSGSILDCVFEEIADAAVDSRAGIYDPTNGTVSRGDIVRTTVGISYPSK